MAAFLFAVICWTYREVPNFQFLTYDDGAFVRDNRRLEGGLTAQNLAWAATANFGNISREAEYWIPATLVTRLYDVQVFGRNPAGHHSTSVLIHALNAVLVFLFIRAATGSPGVGAFTALIFGLHPLNVEATCWIASRKDLLSGTFSFLALWAYLRFARAPKLSGYLGVLGLFALALMSKPSVVSLPLAFLLLDLWPSRRLFPRDDWNRAAEWRNAGVLILEKVPFLLFGLFCSALTYAGQSDVGGVGGAMNTSLGWRLAEGLLGYVTYLRQLVWPSGLCVLYPALTEPPDLRLVAAAGVFLLALLAGALRAARYSRVPLFSWCWFIGLLLPLVGIIPFGRQSIADRYLYVAMLGPILFAVVAGRWAWIAAGVPTWSKTAQTAATIALALAVTVPLSVASHAQSLTWMSTRTVWERALQVNPENSFVLQSLGAQDSFDRRYREAAMDFRLALKIDQENFEALRRFSAFLLGRRQYAAAGRIAERALKLAPSDMETHDYVIASLDRSGRKEDARLARARRENIRGRLLIQSVQGLLEAGEWALAAEQMNMAGRMGVEIDYQVRREAVMLPPNFPIDLSPWLAENAPYGPPAAVRRVMRGVTRRLHNDRGAAQADFRAALQLEPLPMAQWWLAIALLESGDRAGAEALHDQILASGSPPGEFPLIWVRVIERLDAPPPVVPPAKSG
ncbi:hypothetical protein AYO41_01660 [Verrucomicrobia bacterium SCGC AG-212-E04]|nr:hypothetical protein AYO41_01660 [Verrucomicrobia bacterium SCGC AG-212-E04]